MPRRTRLIAAAILALATLLQLAFTANPDAEGGQFFGLWRTRHMLVSLLGASLTCLLLASPALRLHFLRWGLLLAVAVVGVEIVGLMGVVSYTDLMNPPRQEYGGELIPHMDERGQTYQNRALVWDRPSEPVSYHFTTDRRGFRNRFDRSEADLYAVGDSLLMYGLVPIEETLTAVLEESTGRPAMNVALVAIGPQRARDIFLEAEFPLRDRLVLQFISEDTDLSDSWVYRRREQTGDEKGSQSLAKRTFLNNLVIFLQKKSTAARAEKATTIGRIGDQDYFFSRLKGSWEGREGEYEHVAAVVQEMKSATERAGGEYAVVLVPAKIRVLGPFSSWPADSSLSGYREHLNPFREWFVAWCESEGIPVMDMTEPLLESTRAGRIPFFEADTHQNGVGHAVMAETLERWEVVQRWNRRTTKGRQ